MPCAGFSMLTGDLHNGAWKEDSLACRFHENQGGGDGGGVTHSHIGADPAGWCIHTLTGHAH